MRPCRGLLIVVLLFFLAGLAGVLYLGRTADHGLRGLNEKQRIAAVLGLSDPVPATEARYIRHLSMADVFAPFQDIPAGFDIFPSGSFYSPRAVPLPDYMERGGK
jgi:hypothetical protein